MKAKFYLFLILGLMQFSLLHSNNNYKFRTLSPPGGFYYDGVKNIQQDIEGFIWILMENSLYRFDGYSYKRYLVNLDSDSPQTREWNFHNMTLSPSGYLLVGTNNGVYLYKKDTDSFKLITNINPHSIQIDKHKNVWVRTDKWKIYDLNTGEFFTPLYDGDSLSYISQNVFCTYNNDLYLFSNYGRIFRYNYTKKEFTLCMTMPDQDGYILKAHAYKGKLWVLVSKYGLYKIDLSTLTIEGHINLQELIKYSDIKSFNIDKNGQLWLGTIYGLYIIDPDTHQYTHHLQSKTDQFSLPNNSIWCIKKDNQENMWIGTYSGAICYVNLDEKNPFKSYFPEEGKLNYIPVSAFAEDSDFIWIGTEGGGINKMNKKTGEFSYYTNKKNTFSYNIKSIIKDKEQGIWIGTYNGGMDYYNIQTKQVRNFQHIKDNSSLLSNNIRKIICAGDSGLWIIYQAHILATSYYSFKNDQFTHYQFDNDSKQRYIFDIISGREDQLWLISGEKIYLFDNRKKTIEIIPNHDSSFMNYHTLCLDDSGNLWIGTIGNGLIYYNVTESKFTQYTDILKHNTFSIYSMCYDGEGKLWLGTDNGLFTYHISNNSFSRYDTNDGVQGQVYYPLAMMKGSNGYLYFGGTNGFTIVNPKETSSNNYKPNVIISDFLINHTPINRANCSTQTDSTGYEIILNHNQANFGFRFSSDNYLMPEKNHFKYRLKGYDEHWIEVDANSRTAFYSKVPPGKYTFEILASNNDGIWNDAPEIITIIRKPAPWQSWYAYLFYCIFAAIICYYIVKYYNNKKKFKLQLYMENVEKEKKEEIHQAQLRFFTNISHDFRTPLSLIIAALEKLRQEGIKEYYYRILNSNAKRLLNLVNELMDFRTIENGKMKLEVQPIDINLFVEEIASDFIDYANQRKINFSFITNPDISTVYVDKNILEKVIMNLLNNAFKYTKEEGEITIEIFADSKLYTSKYSNYHVVKGDAVPPSTFSIVVKDSGVGISKESIENVFERFYKVKTNNLESHLGTGIGLALVKSFVILHKGKITLYSEREQGTEIEVCFSKDKKTYNKNEFLVINDEASDNTIEIADNENQTSSEPNFTFEDDTFQKPDKERKRILLAEDNEDLRQIIADFLSGDYEIIEAEDGMQASKLLSTRMIDFIISDIMMPKKDGITFSKEVKSNLETSHIPIMLLTAKTSLESKIEGADSGADYYFEKPIDLNLLKLSIQNIFKQQQQLKEYYAKNYFADNADLSSNERDNKFMKDFIKIIDDNLDHPEMDVNYIASELSMSRSKLYRKIKTMTDKSIVEFILSHRLRKAARLIIEEDMTMRQVMEEVGIESQPYFTNAFKKEFGETPSSFANKYKKKKNE